MSWYRVQEIDILRVGQLYLQQGITSEYPSAGVLYTDGTGGTFWSTPGAGGGGGGGGTVTDAVLTSTIQGLGLLSYVSSTQLQSTVQGLGNFYTSTAASGVLGYQLISTVDGLGLARYASTTYVTAQISSFSTSLGAVGAGNLTTANLASTVAGLGTAGYLSTVSTFPNTVSTAFLNTTLASTVAGLGTAGYLSTVSTFPNTVSTAFLNTTLASTVAGLGTAGYLSTVSTFPNTVSTPFLNTTLASTVAGLGTAGYLSTVSTFPNTVSTAFLNTTLASTVAGLGTAGYLSTVSTFPNTVSTAFLNTTLASTVAGLGTAGYISTLANLVSTPFLNTTLASTVSGLAVQQTISSLTVNQLTFGSGTGWIQLGPIQSPIVSTIQENVQSNYTNNLFLGTVSAATAAKFYGLTGLYTNTALAEISTGAGTQEFLIFKGSSVSDRVRVQTTGGFVVETGVSARTWNENTGATLPLTTPAFVVTSTSNVGIQTASPLTALDVGGTVRAPNLSTQSLVFSSINGLLFGTPISTVALFTSNTALSISSLYGVVSSGLSSVALFTSNSSNYSQNLLQNTSTWVSTVALFTSNSSNYSQNLLQNTSTWVSTVALFTSNSSNYSQNLLQNTSTWISTVALFTSNTSNFASNILQDYSTLIQSTAIGLGTLGYASTTYVTAQISSFSTSLGAVGAGNITTQNLTSTVDGLGTARYASTSFVGAQISTFSTSISAAIGGAGISQTVLNSTFVGLATGGYISSTQLFSTVAGIGTGGGITTPQLISTTNGLGTIQYASTKRVFISTTSTIAISWPPINVQTVLIQDWSTPVSTVALFTSNTSNFYRNTIVNTSTPLFSTVANLGIAGYASTKLVFIPNISTQAVLPFPSIGNPPLSTVSASFGTFSTLTGLDTYVNTLTFSNQTELFGTNPTELFLSTGSTTSTIRIQAPFFVTQVNNIGINCNAPTTTLDVSGSGNFSGPLTSRVRVIGSTIAASQTIRNSDIASFFFYTVNTPGVSITVPTAAQVGAGWSVTIQNTSNSIQTLNILTSPNVVLSRGQTVRIFSDGSSWYFI